MTTKITEARQSAAVKLQKAFQRAQEQSARERKAGEDLMNKNKEKPVKEGYRGYNNNRTGFARRPREDDEYHTPDPVTQTHKIAFNVSKDGAEKHSRTVTISNSTKSRAEAAATARAHLEKQGYKIHEEVELDEAAKGHTIEAHGIRGMKGTPWRKTFKSQEHLNDWAEKNDSVEVHGTRELEKSQKVNEESDVYAKAEENKRSAEDAKKHNRPFDYHMHMADHHDNMAQWHHSKGRHMVATHHERYSEQHHEAAMKLKESTDACPVCGQTPCNCTHIEEANTTHQHHVVSKLDGAVLASYKTKEEAHKNAQGNKVVSGSLETIGDRQYVREAWSQGNRNPQRGIKVGHRVRSYDFPGMHDDHYIEGHVVGETPHTYHIRVNRVVRGGKDVPTPAHMTHVEAPKGKGMFNQAYAVHKIIAKQDSVAAAAEPAKGAAKTFSKIRGQR